MFLVMTTTMKNVYIQVQIFSPNYKMIIKNNLIISCQDKLKNFWMTVIRLINQFCSSISAQKDSNKKQKSTLWPCRVKYFVAGDANTKTCSFELPSLNNQIILK